MAKMKKVMVFGTFDIIHPGHLFLFRKARASGDYVTVVIARDKTVRKVRGRDPVHAEGERLRRLKDLHVVHAVVLGDEVYPYRIIDEVKPDVICLGYDQKVFVQGLEKHLKQNGLKSRIVRVGPYKPQVYHSMRFRRTMSAEVSL